MSSQIFKEDFDILPIVEYLKDICNHTVEDQNICIEVTNESYNKSKLNNSIYDFLNYIKEYYYESKLNYVERKLTYNRYITILRQICKFKGLIYKSDIKYNKSNYTIVYYIYIDV